MDSNTIVNIGEQQIEEKKYEAELVFDGFSPERIRKYGFAFREKNACYWNGVNSNECLIG